MATKQFKPSPLSNTQATVYVMQSQKDMVGWGSTLPVMYGPEQVRNFAEALAVGYRRIEDRTYYLVRFVDGVFGVKASYLPKEIKGAFLKQPIIRDINVGDTWWQTQQEGIG